MGYHGQPFRPDADERALWSQAEREEEKLARRGKIYEDRLLEDYLAGVAAKVVPPEVMAAGGPPVRIVILRDPALNVFAMPNGHVYVHTGLLARIENEAQLAMILGHELTHVTNRHAFRLQGDARSPRPPEPSGGFAGLGLPLASIAAVSGFGRDLEREADLEGMARMVAAGYDPREAPKAFARLKQDHGDGGRLERFFFGNRSQLGERIRSTTELLRRRHAAADTAEIGAGEEEFAARMRVVVRENAALDIGAGRFRLARDQLDRVLARTPGDPVAHVYYGDLYRIQAQQARRAEGARALLSQAREAYERAATLDPGYPDPFRQLGLLYYQSKDTERAREAFQKYLGLRPDGPDARRVKEYLVELSRR